jgi:HlyD family secretion protein
MSEHCYVSAVTFAYCASAHANNPAVIAKSRPGSLNMRRFLLGTVLLGAIAAGLAYLLSRDGSDQRFITAPVERGTISTSVKATGSVDAVITVDVSSQLSGRVSEVLVNYNDEVKADQPIARLDPEIFAARVSEAKAVLKVATATAEQQKSAFRRTKAALESARTSRKISEAQLAAAQARQQEIERDVQRNTTLARTASVSDRELTQSRAQRDAGAANLRALEEDVTLKAQAIEIADAEVSMAQANVQNAEAVVEQRQAALEQAELDLARTVIRAPIDGVIIKRDVNPGQTVAVTLEAKTLFKIAQDLREMEVRGRIDEADVGRLRVGQTTRFTVDAYPDRAFTGQVLQIRKSPEVVQNVVTYTAIISAPNPDLLLLPGMTAVLRIVISETGDVLKIPNQALRFRPPDGERAPNDGAAARGVLTSRVWILGDGGTPTPVQVTLGVSNENSTEVQEGQQVIVGIGIQRSRTSWLGLRLGF